MSVRMQRILDGWCRSRAVVRAVAAVILLAIPGCFFDRSAVETESLPDGLEEWDCNATLLPEGPGAAPVHTSNSDPVLTGGYYESLATDGDDASGDGPEARIKAAWKRYLAYRFANPPAPEDVPTEQFQARFGSGTPCLVREPTCARTGGRGRRVTDSEWTDTEPLARCSAPLGDGCDNPPGVRPVLSIDLPWGPLTFLPAPVQPIEGPAAEWREFTVSNIGDRGSRICLALQIEEPSHPQDFLLDFLRDDPCLPRPGEDEVVLDDARPSCTVRAWFRPTARGDRTALLRLTTFDEVPLQGIGLPGVLVAEPASVCLNGRGTIIGDRLCRDAEVTVRNEGPGLVTLWSGDVALRDRWERVRGFRRSDVLGVGESAVAVVRACEPEEDGLFIVSHNGIHLDGSRSPLRIELLWEDCGP